MRKNRTGPLRGKNNNNYSNNNIAESNNPNASPDNWADIGPDIDRAAYENCFRFGSRTHASGMNLASNLSQPSTSGLQAPIMTNGINQQNGSVTGSANATYADDSDDEVFGLGASAATHNGITGEPNFALNNALSFQKFLCSSSKKSSSSKMPNIQSSANEFDGNQQRLEDELRNLNLKLDATQRALSMMTRFIEQQQHHNAPSHTFPVSQPFNSYPLHNGNQFDQSNHNHARNAQISQQFFTAIKQQHDLIRNQNDLICDQNELILQWLEFTNGSTNYTSPRHSHQEYSHVHTHRPQQHQHTSHSHPQHVHTQERQSNATGFSFVPNNSVTSSAATSSAPVTVPSTLNNQIRPRTRENNFFDNFRSLSHQNDLHPSGTGSETLPHQQPNKVGNLFEFRNSQKSNRKKLNNFEMPSTSSLSSFPIHHPPPSSTFAYQTSPSSSIFANNSVPASGASSVLKSFRGPSRVPRTVLNVKNIAGEEEKNLKRSKTSNNLNHVICGLNNVNRNVDEHEIDLPNGQEIRVEGGEDEDDRDNDDDHDEDVNADDDDCQEDIIDDHDSVDEAQSPVMKLIVGNTSANSSLGGAGSFHHTTKVTSARPLMPAEGQSSEPVVQTVPTSSSINSNGWSYRPPATGSTNDSGLTSVPTLSSTLLSSVSSTLSNSEERLDDLNCSLNIAPHSDAPNIVSNGHLNDHVNNHEENELRPMVNGDGHDDIEEDDNFGLNSVSDTDVRLISLATAGPDAARHSSIRHSGDGEQGL